MAEPTPTPAEKAAATRKRNAAKRSTAAKKAAATRAANRGAAARSTATRKARATATRAESTASRKTAEARREVRAPLNRAAELAERAVLVPVGATLVARDSVASAIGDLRATYSTRKRTEQELRRFERRGSGAVRRIERDAKRTRTRVERELRQQRARVERELRARTEPVVKNAELVGARVENAVQGGRTAATQATTKVQERIAGLV
jgi:hypothetical protein